MRPLMQKHSTVLISVGDNIKVFRSVDEVPSELREKLIESTHGINSATILIADKGGREEILRALQRPESGVSPRLVASLMAHLAGSKPQDRPRLFLAMISRVLLVGSIGLLLWLLAAVR